MHAEFCRNGTCGCGGTARPLNTQQISSTKDAAAVGTTYCNKTLFLLCEHIAAGFLPSAASLLEAEKSALDTFQQILRIGMMITAQPAPLDRRQYSDSIPIYDLSPFDMQHPSLQITPKHISYIQVHQIQQTALYSWSRRKSATQNVGIGNYESAATTAISATKTAGFITTRYESN